MLRCMDRYDPMVDGWENELPILPSPRDHLSGASVGVGLALLGRGIAGNGSFEPVEEERLVF